MSKQVACRITKISQLTKTIRQVIVEAPLTAKTGFKPGQWVDFWPTGFENPGGFSISSSPNELPKIELAIRTSPHPVVKWVFSDKCIEGENIQVAIGGEWFLKKRKKNQKRIILVAGGVGINPILSMLRNLSADDDKWKDIILIYSARNWEDILYKNEVLEMMEFLPQLRIHIYLTQVDHIPTIEMGQVQVQKGRLTKESFNFNDITSSEESVAYLCGPPQMSETVSDWLQDSISEINFEKWW